MMGAVPRYAGAFTYVTVCLIYPKPNPNDYSAGVIAFFVLISTLQQIHV